MPLYEFATTDGEIIEMIFSWRDCPDELISSTGRIARRQMSAMANTPGKWGDSHEKPYFDRGLGRVVQGRKHAHAIAKSRGLIPYEDLGSPSEADRFTDSLLSKQASREAAEAAHFAEQAHILETQGPAAEEAWFVHKALNTPET